MSDDHFDNIDEKEELQPGEEEKVVEAEGEQEVQSTDEVEGQLEDSVDETVMETEEEINVNSKAESEEELQETSDNEQDEDISFDDMNDDEEDEESISLDKIDDGSIDEDEGISLDNEDEALAESEEPVVEEAPKNLNKWYSLRVISGKERKIKERIELEIQRSGWKDFITQVLVPSEKVYKIRNGKKVILERNILPGYILVEADPNKFRGDMVQAIANIPNVIHFLGRNNPIPMQPAEANRMLGKVDDSQDMGESMIEPFIVGETVKIIDGPFNEFVGDIQEVNEEKKKLKVIVKIFGRGTEVELNFMQVEKQS